jgi:hypothetical protein
LCKYFLISRLIAAVKVVVVVFVEAFTQFYGSAKDTRLVVSNGGVVTVIFSRNHLFSMIVMIAGMTSLSTVKLASGVAMVQDDRIIAATMNARLCFSFMAW